MAFNFWRHLRLAGAVVIIASAIFHLSISITLVGLLIQFIGLFGAVGTLEQRVEKLEKGKSNDENEA
jgi:hypothetical protein